MVLSRFKLITDDFACPIDEIDGLEVMNPTDNHPERGIIIYWKGYQTMLPDPDGQLFKRLTRSCKPIFE